MHFLTYFFEFQNDMGLKAHDCAKLMGQKECAEFLILYETSLEMASELSEVQSKREMLLVEHNELRTYFKYVNLYSPFSLSHCLKTTQNVSFSKNCQFFWQFNEFFSTQNVNVARFARN